MLAGTFFEPALERNHLWNGWWSCSAQRRSQSALSVLLWLCSPPSELSHPVTALEEGVHCSGKHRLCRRDDADLYLTFVLCKICAVSGGCSSCSFSSRAATTSACAALKMWVLWSRELCICTLFWGVMHSEEVSPVLSFQCIFFSLWELIE